MKSACFELDFGDNQTIIEKEFDYETRVMNIARNNIVSPVEPSCSETEIDGKTVGILSVPKGRDRLRFGGRVVAK